ncbi:hypothetical protein L3Q82_007786 [Scortum barcoo]|uniref:Uncharacterized protein n=1 Tax=Scortum barcoo TaxID=214431 RepID=A0ACB8WN38_9TELE|nr:hypothetical protein L3Q82_007786 [Scortum barcoo]
MDGQRSLYEMENPTENPSKAAEYLKELNKIIETQQGLLEKQRDRIDELELQVTDLCKENACLKDQHQRHLATCRLQQGSLSSLGAIRENVMHENAARNGQQLRMCSKSGVKKLSLPSIHPSIFICLIRDRVVGGSSMSRDAQTSLTPDTSSSSSGGTPRRSQASRET